jgi:uncharacterized membrane protein YczE
MMVAGTIIVFLLMTKFIDFFLTLSPIKTDMSELLARKNDIIYGGLFGCVLIGLGSIITLVSRVVKS